MGTRAKGWVLVTALVGSACGGSVNLESPRDTGGSGGSEGGKVHEGGRADEQAGSGGIEEQGSGGREEVGGSAPLGGAPSTNSGGNSSSGSTSLGGSPTKEPDPGGASQGGAPEPGTARIAWLALDAQPEGESRGVYWMSAVEGGVCSERLTESDITAKQPAFSSDGKFLAYAADDTGTYQIYLRDLATGMVTQVTDLPEGATYPTFAPNGLVLAFVTGDPEGLRDGALDDTPEMGDVALVNLKTLAVTRLETRDAQYPYFAPAFSGNDRLIVSNSFVIRAFYLESVGDSLTVANERVLSSHGVPQEPAPSPDGQTLAYADTCSDTLRLYSLRIDLGSPRSCSPPSRDVRDDAGVRGADWGSFGFIATEFVPPGHGIQLFSETDLQNAGTVATPASARNPAWAPADFTRSCE